MGVLRGGPGDLSPRLPYITRPMWLRRVTNRPVGPLGLSIYYAPLSVDHSPTSSFDGFGNVMSVFFDQYYIYYYFVYDLILNLIERLGLKWLSMFSVGGHIRVWILFCFIILFYLAGLFEILVYPKSFFLWHLVGTKKVENSPLASDWYREAPIYYYICFVIHG
jgi:hypothetical protein